jgi:IS5 family transposase
MPRKIGFLNHSLKEQKRRVAIRNTVVIKSGKTHGPAAFVQNGIAWWRCVDVKHSKSGKVRGRDGNVVPTPAGSSAKKRNQRIAIITFARHEVGNDARSPSWV